MKRSPLRRKTSLRATRRTKAKPTKYKLRERAPESWWRFVKSQPCVVEQFLALQRLFIAPIEIQDLPLIETVCGGVIEADHEGKHGLSHKGPDNEVAPICTQHHRERTDHTGAFKQFKKADMHTFVAIAILRTHRLAQIVGVEIPTC